MLFEYYVRINGIIIVFYDETNEIFAGLRRFCFIFREFHTIAWIFIETPMIFIDSGPVRTPTAAIFIRKNNENHRYFDKFCGIHEKRNKNDYAGNRRKADNGGIVTGWKDERNDNVTNETERGTKKGC